MNIRNTTYSKTIVRSSLFILVVGIILGIGINAFFVRTEAGPIINRTTFQTFFARATTDNKGYFSVQHELETPKYEDHYEIVGIVGSVQHKNGNWATLEMSHKVDNRFWWNEKRIEGLIGSPSFYNRPVKIIIFALPRAA